MFSADKDIEFYRTADNFYIFFLSNTPLNLQLIR